MQGRTECLQPRTLTMTHHAKIAVAAALLLLSTGYIAGRYAAYGQTQFDMDMDSYHDFQKADKQLNTVYQQLIKRYSDSDDVITRRKIVAAERAWVAYRDAEANMEASAEGEGGSIYPMLVNEFATSITEERIKTLKQVAKGDH